MTKKDGDNYSKTIATVETDLPPGVDAVQGLQQISESIDAFLQPGSSVKQPQQQQTTAVVKSPSLQLTPPVESLWKVFREGHRAGWTKLENANAEFASALAKGPVTVGEFVYKISGNDGRLISRNPLKG